MRLGAKLSFETANNFGNSEGFDYFELFTELEKIRDKREWENWEVIHAPRGTGFASFEHQEDLKRAIGLAIKSGSKYFIVHSGVFGQKQKKDVITNLRHLTNFADKSNIRLLLENLHYLNGEHHASSAEELEGIIGEVGCGFVLDFAHAQCYSLQKGLNSCKFTMDLTKLKPEMYHLSDSFRTDKIDKHLTLGKGDLDIKFYLKIIGNGICTLEISPPTVDNYVLSKRFIEAASS